jgi:hypothetical protein
MKDGFHAFMCMLLIYNVMHMKDIVSDNHPYVTYLIINELYMKDSMNEA